jgi:hypothetical protein
MNKISILQNVKSANIMSEPYPIYHNESCLDQNIFSQLLDEYPDPNLIIKSNSFREPIIRQNQRHDMCANQSLSNNNISELWLDFVKFHTSNCFYREVISVFGDDIKKEYPWLEEHFKCKLEDIPTQVRYLDDDDNDQAISLDCQIGLNTPVKVPSSVRGPHGDASVELFAFLLYFGGDIDNGGDLEIYKWKDVSKIGYMGEDAPLKNLELVKTIKSHPNTCAGFINSPKSIHAVTPRGSSENYRLLVNIIGEVNIKGGLFKKNQTNIIKRYLRSIKRRGLEFIRK